MRKGKNLRKIWRPDKAASFGPGRLYEKLFSLIIVAGKISYIQGVFFDWSPQKSLSMELALPPDI